MLYATVMVFVYPLGIPLFYFMVLKLNASELCPALPGDGKRRSWYHRCCTRGVVRRQVDNDGVEAGLQEEIDARQRVLDQLKARKKHEEKLKHLSFLWEAYEPGCYWYVRLVGCVCVFRLV